MSHRPTVGVVLAALGVTCALLIALGVAGGLEYGARGVKDAVSVVVHGKSGSGRTAAEDQFAPTVQPRQHKAKSPKGHRQSPPTKTPPTSTTPSAPPVRAPGAGGCANYRSYGYPTQQACVEMAIALSTHKARACGKDRWRTLYHFPSRRACHDFVKQGG